MDTSIHAIVTKIRHVLKRSPLSFLEKTENKYKLMHVNNTIKCNNNKCAQQ